MMNLVLDRNPLGHRIVFSQARKTRCGLEYPGCVDRQHHRKPRREIPSRQSHGERLGRRVRKRGDSGFGPRVHSVGRADRPGSGLTQSFG